MENSVIAYSACICFLIIFIRVFIIPIKKIFKLVFSSVIGGFVVFFINIIGILFEFHLGLNVYTSVIGGLLGIPGIICMVLLKLII